MSILRLESRKLEFKCSKGKVNAEADFIEDDIQCLRCVCCSVSVTVGRNRILRMLSEEIQYFRDKKLQDSVMGAIREVGAQSIDSSMPELIRPEWEFILVENEYLVKVLTHG